MSSRNRFLVGCLLLAACCLLLAGPAAAQKDKMSLGESFGAVILRPAAGKQPSPMLTLPKDALSVQETMVPVKRPPMPPPAVPKAP